MDNVFVRNCLVNDCVIKLALIDGNDSTKHVALENYNYCFSFLRRSYVRFNFSWKIPLVFLSSKAKPQVIRLEQQLISNYQKISLIKYIIT